MGSGPGATIAVRSAAFGDVFGGPNFGTIFGLLAVAYPIGGTLAVYVGAVALDATGSYAALDPGGPRRARRCGRSRCGSPGPGAGRGRASAVRENAVVSCPVTGAINGGREARGEAEVINMGRRVGSMLFGIALAMLLAACVDSTVTPTAVATAAPTTSEASGDRECAASHAGGIVGIDLELDAATPRRRAPRPLSRRAPPTTSRPGSCHSGRAPVSSRAGRARRAAGSRTWR